MRRCIRYFLKLEILRNICIRESYFSVEVSLPKIRLEISSKIGKKYTPTKLFRVDAKVRGCIQTVKIVSESRGSEEHFHQQYIFFELIKVAKNQIVSWQLRHFSQFSEFPSQVPD